MWFPALGQWGWKVWSGALALTLISLLAILIFGSGAGGVVVVALIIGALVIAARNTRERLGSLDPPKRSDDEREQ